jgi:hypothetical protein
MNADASFGSRRFHIYIPSMARIACDAPHPEVRAVVAEHSWRFLDRGRICRECLQYVDLRDKPGGAAG